jgi:zinc transporter ZupT
MAISAASFLYIVLADLSPELHRKVGVKHAITQFLLMVTGVGTIVLCLQFYP